jgi:hypothetical protein
MIPPAPADFWSKVVERVAQLIWERETGGMKSNPAYLSVPIEDRLRFARRDDCERSASPTSETVKDA